MGKKDVGAGDGQIEGGRGGASEAEGWEVLCTNGKRCLSTDAHWDPISGGTGSSDR